MFSANVGHSDVPGSMSKLLQQSASESCPQSCPAPGLCEPQLGGASFEEVRPAPPPPEAVPAAPPGAVPLPDPPLENVPLTDPPLEEELFSPAWPPSVLASPETSPPFTLPPSAMNSPAPPEPPSALV